MHDFHLLPWTAQQLYYLGVSNTGWKHQEAVVTSQPPKTTYESLSTFKSKHAKGCSSQSSGGRDTTFGHGGKEEEENAELQQLASHRLCSPAFRDHKSVQMERWATDLQH